MRLVDLIGYAAGICVVGSLIPQLIKSWKTKSTNDLSLARYIIYIVGVVLWMVYGFIITNGPMIVMNIAALLMALSILYLKLRYDRH